MTDGLKPWHVGELHGKVFIGLFGFISLALRPEQVTQAYLRHRSSLTGGKFVGDAFKNSLSLLAFTHGIELGAKTEQRKNGKWVACVLGGEFLECLHRRGFLILIPKQIRLQQQRIGSGIGAGIAGNNEITVFNSLGTREEFSSLVGLEAVLMLDHAEGDERDHNDDEKPDELAQIVLQKLFHACGWEFLRDGIELGHRVWFWKSSERLAQKMRRGKFSKD